MDLCPHLDEPGPGTSRADAVVGGVAVAHEHDTPWCGLLLGGCGVQPATKLCTNLL
ncbi:hypothetical protein [Streptomyces graminofaciens]|uniref:hypothetical protein n=1 Tax=Streptomyces graminofaciens TaxID=68212 RepID=UPI0025730368|nr:hypothetical protein [Streptomyces graminofaciens]